jgi:hypothetical protein
VATIPETIEELQYLSDRLSDRVRTVAWSVLGLVWLFLTGGDSRPALPVTPSRSVLLISGALALGALVLDYLQYFFGYLMARQVLQEAEGSAEKNAQYDTGGWLYRTRTFVFWLKQVVMGLALVALCVAVLQALF